MEIWFPVIVCRRMENCLTAVAIINLDSSFHFC